MIDTVLLCMAWAVIGYALAIIEHERAIEKYERDSHDLRGKSVELPDWPFTGEPA